MCYLGIDVSLATLEVAGETTKAVTYPNDAAGIAALVAAVRALAPTLVVLEATSVYHASVTSALIHAGLPTAVVNPRQVRDFARGTGQRAKTDQLDAQVLARFAAAVQPVPRVLPDAATQELAALVDRRRQLLEMQVAETHRLAVARASVRAEITKHIRYLQRAVARADTDLDDWIRRSPVWRAHDDLLQSAPGVGKQTAHMLIARLPELGQLTGKQIAALTGLAPFARDSGRLRGKRVISGGRAPIRAMLYMATVSAIRCNPVIAAHYRRLRAAGKPAKLALTACMRHLLLILNAMMKSNTPWHNYAHTIA